MRSEDIAITTFFCCVGLIFCVARLFHAGLPILVFAACWVFVSVNPLDVKRGSLPDHTTFLAQLQPSGKRAKSVKQEQFKAESPTKKGRSKKLSVEAEVQEDGEDEDEGEAVEICLGVACKRKNDLLQLQCGDKFCRNCLDDLHWAGNGMNKCPKCKTEVYELPKKEPSWFAKALACALVLFMMAHGWTLFDTIILSKTVDQAHMVLTAAVFVMFCSELGAVICLAKGMHNYGNRWPSQWMAQLRACGVLMLPIALFLALGAAASVYQPSLPLDAGAGGFVQVAVDELFEGPAWALAGPAVCENLVVEPEPEPEPEPATAWQAFFNRGR